MFELPTFLTDSKFDVHFKRFVVECKFVVKFYDCYTTDFICTESIDKPVLAFNNCSLCDGLNLRKKNRFVCTLWLCVHMKSVVEQDFCANSHSTTKRLKHTSNFESENSRSSNVVEFKFELRHISI